MRRRAALIAVAAAMLAAPNVGLLEPAPARAGLAGTACNLLGTFGEGWWGKACNGVVDVGGKLAGAGKKAGGVFSKLAGNGLVQRGVGIAAIVAWVLGGARWTIDHLGSVISASTSPTLTAHWFTGVYLRIEGLALFFTLLFIVAAAAEALLRSDLGVIARAVLVQLPLAALLTAVAAPVTMLLLAATDQLSNGIASLAGSGATHFLTGTGAWVAAGLTVADPFFAVLAAGLVVAAGGALWVELLIREVAVYVVVAMLPVAFAALVWPARRVWAVRAIELLVALILAKVGIVAVLALGGAALAHAGLGSLSRLLGGLALILLGAFTPWLLLRLIPLAEVASAAVGHVRGHLHSTAGMRTPEAVVAGRAAERVRGSAGADSPRGNGAGTGAADIAVGELLEQMQRRAESAENGAGPRNGTGAAANSSPRPPASEVDESQFAPPVQMRLPIGPRADGDATESERPAKRETPGSGDPGRVVSPSWDEPLAGGGGEQDGLRPLPPADPGEPPLDGGNGSGAA